MKPDPKGQPAVTKWKVMGASRCMARATWLALEPLTGRTHQLRVHCAEMGWPILGDAIYGNAPRSGGPTCICMRAKSWCRSTRKRAPVRVTAPVPPHMRERLLRACGVARMRRTSAVSDALTDPANAPAMPAVVPG